MKTLTLITIIISLTGCAQYRFVKSGVSPEQSARDQLYCSQYGMQASMTIPGGSPIRQIMAEQQCMQALGYYQVEVK